MRPPPDASGQPAGQRAEQAGSESPKESEMAHPLGAATPTKLHETERLCRRTGL